MKIYITKYACTQGIIEREVPDDAFKHPLGPLHFKNDRGVWEYWHTLEWKPTRAEAIAKAKEMVSAKIKSLHKSLKKLEAYQAELEAMEGAESCPK